MKRTITALLATSVLAGLVILAPGTKHGLTVVPVVHAQSGCSVATLSGNYGFTFGGSYLYKQKNGSKKDAPWVGAGLAKFDGAGNATATWAQSSDGQITTNNSWTGTYTVNSDCTGLLTATPGSGGANMSFAIVGGGAEALGVDTDRNSAWTIDFKKQ
jgi:hypothetical protein